MQVTTSKQYAKSTKGRRDRVQASLTTARYSLENGASRIELQLYQPVQPGSYRGARFEIEISIEQAEALASQLLERATAARRQARSHAERVATKQFNDECDAIARDARARLLAGCPNSANNHKHCPEFGIGHSCCYCGRIPEAGR